jgi:hypothetical protein
MTRFAILFALIVSAPAAAQAAPVPKADPQAPSPKLKNLLENCDAHKFETTVDTLVDGKPHRSKVKLCGTEGQSDSDWIGTLNDAVAKLDSNKEMAAAVRDQIETAVKAEIARLESQASEAASTGPELSPRQQSSPTPLSSDYTTLPPLPAPLARAPSLPVANAPATSSGVVSAAPVIARVAPAVNPHLSFSCMSAEYPGGGECITLSRDTILTVKAGGAVPAAVSLRFLRRGEERAQVAVGGMRKGQSLRFQLPQQVCSGVSTAEVEMEVMNSGQTVDRKGPYLLHC